MGKGEGVDATNCLHKIKDLKSLLENNFRNYDTA
jgi:hypothetical protein